MKKNLFAALGFLLAANTGATTVRVHYDAGKGNIAILGDKGPMTWSTGVSAKAGPGNVWTYTWPDQLGDIAMKPARGDKVSIGGAYKIAAGASADIYPFFGAPFGTVTILAGVESPQLKNSRSLRIFLPASYQENQAKRYPVLYMHDGQNLFDAKTASYGVEWGIDETVNRLVAAGIMDEVIVVGIDNTADRIAEYTPCCDPKHGGGKLDAYEAFIVDTVKPMIDKTLRTLPGKESTALMGSSLGGLASVIIAQHRPDVFSKAGGVSSSFWWNERALVKKSAARVPVKFYIDAGTSGDGMEETLLMRDAMLAQGYSAGADLLFYSAEGGKHNEKSWAERVEKPLTWFFPWGGTKY
jgi:predicted alpha/beta superfamily hydrolase